VAATDRYRRHAARKRLWQTRGARWCGAGLASLAARAVHGQSFVDSRVLYYKESGGRMQVIDPVLLLHQDLGERVGQFDLLLGYDAISGASPTGAYPTSDVTTSASGHTIASGAIPTAHYTDHRESLSLSYGRKFGSHFPTVNVSYSREKDYVARSIGATDAWTVAGGLGTIHAGISISRDVVEPVTNHLHLPKREDGYSLGYTHILGERDVLDVSASLMRLRGYLDDPYTVVPVGTPTVNVDIPEHRPSGRDRRALFVKYAHAYLWGGALKASYRYYNDNWSVQAHTLDVEYEQRLSDGWIVSPEVRLYTQSRARFYGDLFSRPETYMSADYRLSPFGSVLGGLTVSNRINETLSVRLGATVQSQRGRDRITPVVNSSGASLRGSSISAADLNVVTVTAGFTWRY
jgi:hypothetical protein